MRNYKKIGILGGMGAEATVDLYMAIWRYYQKKHNAKFDDDFPAVIIYSVPIPDVVESLVNEEKTLKMLVESAQTLENDGCDFLIIACNTVQFLLKRIQNEVKIPIIGIAEVNARYIQKLGLNKVGILATQTTIAKKIYDEELNRIGIDAVVPSREDQLIVTNVIMNQLAGKTSEDDKQNLVEVIGHLNELGVEAVLLACTDLPVVMKGVKTIIPTIDCTEVYANKAAELAENIN